MFKRKQRAPKSDPVEKKIAYTEAERRRLLEKKQDEPRGKFEQR